MKIMKSLFSFFALSSMLFAPVITLAAGNVTISYLGAPAPLFNITNMAPGDSFTKTLTVTNNSTANQTLKFTVGNTGTVGLLSDKITLKVINAATSAEKYNSTLLSLFSAGEVNLDSIAPSGLTNYDFTVTFDKDAGNEYMGLAQQFDLTVGFTAAQTPITLVQRIGSALGLTPSPTPVAVTDNAPVVAGATTDNSTVDQGVKGVTTTASEKTCPWWWIIALVYLAATAFLGGVIRAQDPEKWVRKYRLAWPAVMGVAAWLLHLWLHNDFAATWFCNNYWLIMLIIAILGEATYGYLLRDKGRTV